MTKLTNYKNYTLKMSHGHYSVKHIVATSREEAINYLLNNRDWEFDFDYTDGGPWEHVSCNREVIDACLFNEDSSFDGVTLILEDGQVIEDEDIETDEHWDLVNGAGHDVKAEIARKRKLLAALEEKKNEVAKDIATLEKAVSVDIDELDIRDSSIAALKSSGVKTASDLLGIYQSTFMKLLGYRHVEDIGWTKDGKANICDDEKAYEEFKELRAEIEASTAEYDSAVRKDYSLFSWGSLD